ncbi:hypothetical protein GJ496_010574 [Pomphorhynchus laevis]|nr:hypothetical protein GJ496_010574 [Pomphorhynchus laevis]
MRFTDNDALKIILVIFFAIIDFFGVFGNCIVIFVITSTRHLNLPQNYLIVSLAFVDLLLSIVSMPLYINTSIFNGRWMLGFQLCRLFMLYDVTLSSASMLNLCAISIDRYFALYYPFKYKFKRNNSIILLLLLGSWSLSCITSIPLLFLKRSELYNQSSRSEQFCIIPLNAIFITIALVVGYYVPLIILIYTNWCIYARLKHRRNTRANAAMTNKVDIYVAKIYHSETTYSSKNESIGIGKSPSVVKKDGRLTLTLCGIVLSTIICWSPFFLLLTISFTMKNKVRFPRVVHEVSLWLGYLNSAINPIIYNFTNLDFKRRLRIICRGNKIV